jgi:uroporphyrinogen-III decarboxylase
MSAASQIMQFDPRSEYNISQRENTLSLLRRQGFRYAPVEFNLCPSLRESFREETGGDFNQDAYPWPWSGAGGPTLPERKIDWLQYHPGGLKEGAVINETWGLANEPGSAAAKHMTHMRHPMEHFDSLEQIQAYPYPEFEQADWSEVEAVVKKLHGEGKAVIAQMACSVWEISWYLRGMEELMMDMAAGDEKAVWHLDRLTEIACIRAAGYARAGVDILHTGDDVGMQHTTLMSPEMYRDWIKPRFAKVIAAAKTIKPDLLVSYHSCGYVVPFIEDFIEVGVDVLNPVQPECMDFAQLHAEYGSRLSFWGTLGTQTTMPFGTPEEVRAVTIRNLEIAGAKGGLLCTPTHLLEPEVPWANIEAYVAATREFSRAGRCAY